MGRTGDLEPLDGMVKRHNHLKIGWFHQHLTELLDLSLNPLEYMFREFPEVRGSAPASRLRTHPSCLLVIAV